MVDQNPAADSPQDSVSLRRRRMELAAVAVFVVVNLVMPFVFEDLYPFTSAPMFRDQPSQYCQYAIYDHSGRQLASEDFQLQRIYDGNPPGVGVGIKPPEVLEKHFGHVASRQEVVRHVRAQLDKHPDIPWVTVEQTVIGPDDKNQITETSRHRWRIERGESPK